jgi:hypothetical protein
MAQDLFTFSSILNRERDKTNKLNVNDKVKNLQKRNVNLTKLFNEHLIV